MTNASTDSITQRFEVHATAESHFSWLRTRLSVERTLMSWLRTSVSLIGFGFTIVQFLDRWSTRDAKVVLFPEGPRYLGLALILSGVVGLLISISQYQATLKYLRSGNYAAIANVADQKKQTPLVAVSAFLALVGTFTFFAVFFHAV